jgi:hypothetical protein
MRVSIEGRIEPRHIVGLLRGDFKGFVFNQVSLSMDEASRKYILKQLRQKEASDE